MKRVLLGWMMLVSPAAADIGWSQYGGDQGGQRHSAATQITPANVTGLRQAWSYSTGVLARHPEARWRVNADALDRLVAASRDLLDAVSRVVRPGGLLCFSTCSLEPEENEMQIEQFLGEHPEFRREPGSGMPAELLSPAGDLTLLPQRHGTDGAFASRLRRQA